jgi:recombination protein RecT
MSSNLPAVKPQTNNPTNTIRALLEKSKGQIAMALPKHLNADRIVRVAMTSVQRTPELLKCDPISLVAAVIQSSQLGLEPDGILGHAYLIPFNNTKKGRMEVQFIPGYKGLIDLARRSGQVVSIGAHVVFENEPFKLIYGYDEKLDHEPLPPSKRGARKGVYAVARLKDGSVHFEWLWAEEVEDIKNGSKARNFGPWKTHEDEMWRKTAIRRLAKYLPLSVEFAKAAAADELADAGVSTAELFDYEEPVIEVSASAKPTIDEAFGKMELVEAGETTEKQTKPDDLFAIQDLIDGFGMRQGQISACALRALRTNKPRDLWSAEEAAKVLEEIKKTKGEK